VRGVFKMAEYIDRRAAITDDLAACKKAFDQAGVPWVIMGGIVLGYARYKEVMAWDTDVDLGVFVELDANKWQQLHTSLCNNGFKFVNNKTDFIYCNRKAEFNMWMFHKSGNYYEAFPVSTPGIKFVEKAIWYDAPQIVDFLGSKYPMPNNMDDYLVCQYGVDWKTNVIKDHEQYYIDKRGTRDVGAWPAGRATKDGDMWPKTLKIDDSMEA
jgi:hypothetical protein